MSFSSRFDMALARVLPRIIRAVEDRILATVSQMLADRERPVAHQGLVISGSYDPNDATVEVLLGDTFGLIGDDGDLPSTLKKIPLHTTGVGRLEPPLGGERTVFNDLGTTFHHGADDSPGAAQNGSPGVAAGEVFQGHRNAAAWADGEVMFDAYDHMTNDGKTAGDGKAGRQIYVGGYAKFFTTSGFTLTLDDTGEQITLTTPTGNSIVLADDPAITITTAGGLIHSLNDATQEITHIAGAATTTINAVTQQITHLVTGEAGQVQTIVDGAGNAISHVVPSGGLLGMGALASSLSTTTAALANEHLTTFEDSLFTARLNDLKALITAMEAAAVPNAGSVLAQLASLAHVSVPSGSSIVRIAG